MPHKGSSKPKQNVQTFSAPDAPSGERQYQPAGTFLRAQREVRKRGGEARVSSTGVVTVTTPSTTTQTASEKIAVQAPPKDLTKQQQAKLSAIIGLRGRALESFIAKATPAERAEILSGLPSGIGLGTRGSVLVGTGTERVLIEGKPTIIPKISTARETGGVGFISDIKSRWRTRASKYAIKAEEAKRIQIPSLAGTKALGYGLGAAGAEFIEFSYARPTRYITKTAPEYISKEIVGGFPKTKKFVIETPPKVKKFTFETVPKVTKKYGKQFVVGYEQAIKQEPEFVKYQERQFKAGAIVGAKIAKREALAIIKRAGTEPGRVAAEIGGIYYGEKIALSATEKFLGRLRTIGKKKVAPKLIIPEEVIGRKVRFPSAPPKIHRRLFETTPFLLPGEIEKQVVKAGRPVLKGGKPIFKDVPITELPIKIVPPVFHAAPKPFSKVTKARKGTSEIPGLYVAPHVSPHFLKLGQPRYDFISFEILPGIRRPAIKRIYPKGIGEIPKLYSGRKGSAKFMIKRAEKGVVYAHPYLQKAEVEGIIKTGTELKRKDVPFFTEWEGIRVPIYRYETFAKVPKGFKPPKLRRGEKIVTTEDILKSDKSYQRSLKRGIVTPRTPAYLSEVSRATRPSRPYRPSYVSSSVAPSRAVSSYVSRPRKTPSYLRPSRISRRYAPSRYSSSSVLSRAGRTSYPYRYGRGYTPAPPGTPPPPTRDLEKLLKKKKLKIGRKFLIKEKKIFKPTLYGEFLQRTGQIKVTTPKSAKEIIGGVGIRAPTQAWLNKLPRI